MTLRPCSDATAADWLVRSPIPWDQLVGFGPSGFDAYARLRFISDPTRIGQSETDVEGHEDLPSDCAQTRQALRVLQQFTASDHWYFCVWEGTGHELPPSIFREPLVELPHRRYFLAEGGPEDSVSWQSYFSDDSAPVPAFVWPSDRAWCFASDVDPHWAGIGGSSSAIAALMECELDIVAARPTDDQPTYF